MAGNVTAVVNDGTLVITGDAAANGITVDYNQTNDTYQVIGTSQGGSDTTVNGLNTATAGNEQIFANVHTLRIAMNAGADALVFGASTSTTFVVDRGVQIEMGSGADTVTIGRNTGASTTANEVNIGRNLTIKLGSGVDAPLNGNTSGDTLNMTNTSVGRDLVIHADDNKNRNGAADDSDTINMITTFTPSGGAEQVFPVDVGGKATVLLGAKNDTFNVSNFSADRLFVQKRGNALNFDLTNSSIRGELKIEQTGAVDTTIDIDNVNAGTLRMTTGNGIDTITIRDSIFERMYLETGAGVDQITIGNTRVRKGGIINGERDKAKVTQEAGNNLRGVLKIKTFAGA